MLRRLFGDVQLQHSEKLQIKVSASSIAHRDERPSRSVRRVSLRPLLQVPSRLREALRTAKESLERRLQEEQRMVRSFLGLLKAPSTNIWCFKSVTCWTRGGGGKGQPRQRKILWENLTVSFPTTFSCCKHIDRRKVKQFAQSGRQKNAG